MAALGRLFGVDDQRRLPRSALGARGSEHVGLFSQLGDSDRAAVAVTQRQFVARRQAVVQQIRGDGD